jgi:Fe-S-cluster containining protein
MSFACTGCGLCCKNVKGVLDASENYEGNDPIFAEAKAFPYKAREDGSCEMLVDGKCLVYENRPDICNVETMWNKHYSKDISKEEYFAHNYTICNGMIKENGLSDKFLIDIK